MTPLPHRRLGTSDVEVSVLALGSWRTYERISREEGVAVMNAARESGIDFLEVARYNDELGTAPIPTGYSEVVFGEVFRASGWPRDEVTIANKLWWEFWPQTPREELAASLERTGLDHFDFMYSDPPPPDLPLTEAVPLAAELVTSGLVRAWGIVNWQANKVAEAGRIAHELGVPAPCAAQLPYSVVTRQWVEDQAMQDALDLCGASLEASHVLAGGVLSGKYAQADATGRMAGSLDDEQSQRALAAAEGLAEVARDLATTPATLAVAFALAYERTATVLLGTTSPDQLRENVAAIEVAERLTDEHIATLRALPAD